MRHLEVLRVVKINVCVWVDLCLGFVGLRFKKKYPDFWEHQKTTIVH
jgi:hypothetical protein